MKKLKLVRVLLPLLLTLSCVIPGISRPAPAPLEPATVIALTSRAAMTQTVAAIPVLSPTPIVPVTNLETLPDGSVKFIHVNGGYEMTYPNGWLTVRPNSDEFNIAYSTEGARNPILLDEMNLDISRYEAGHDQLYSYALRPDLVKDAFFGFSQVEWGAGDNVPLNDATLGEVLKELESSGEFLSMRIEVARVYPNPNQVDLLEVGGQVTGGDEQSGLIPLYATIVYFKPTADTVVRVIFSYLKDFQPELSGDVTNVINSIALSSPAEPTTIP